MVQDLSDFISTVGFPIVVAIAMFYQNNTLSANYQKLTQQLQDKIESNTEILTRLIEKLDQDDLLKKRVIINDTTNRQAQTVKTVQK